MTVTTNTPQNQAQTTADKSFKASDKSAFAMQAPETLCESTLYITESALNRLRFLKAQQKKNTDGDSLPSQYLRISVLSGGCYGFQYKFEFDAKPTTQDDLIFTHEDITVVIDDVSYDLLKDTTLDYVQELIGAAFTLKNPNSEASCGCGNSFSI